MAGGWIKIEHSTPDKPEVMRIARTIGVSENEVLGGLVRFWLWCDYQSRDGHALGVTQSGLDRIAGVTGMYAAMLDAGWLVEDANGVHAPNYDYHLSENSKARALAAKRKAKQRSSDVTEVSRSERDKSVTREEKRREEKKEYIHSPPADESWKADVVVPNGWDESQTLEALSNWRVFRAAEDGTVPQSMSLLFLVQGKSGAGWTSAKFAESVRYTIANGWKCLADPETSRDKRRNGHKASGDAPPKPAPKVGDVTGFSAPLPSPELQRQIDLCEAAKAHALSEGKTPEEARELARQLARELAKAERKAIA